ncbi:hypothetical protein HOY34_09870 [Xinfangfangia sp. D13-10-4-6]|uniref:hypothetical protein n=1 Tax=Pseudogemmobacter hezensis TaxID=2737662 RepID=UPI001557D426|nr:hypothetical protein [Pseudogemmobacter hezensis]NPD15506.1 hypothetical protein [Pseudogemmobacter hezensis]
MALPVAAQTVRTFENPCNRGPVSNWGLINDSRAEFVDFIQEIRPGMPRDTAGLIAHEVCDDLTIVGNTSQLTGRLMVLLRKYGY